MRPSTVRFAHAQDEEEWSFASPFAARPGLPHPERERSEQSKDARCSRSCSSPEGETPLRRATIIAVALLLSAAIPALADPVKLRIGWSDVPSSLTPILDVKPALAQFVHHYCFIDRLQQAWPESSMNMIRHVNDDCGNFILSRH